MLVEAHYRRHVTTQSLPRLLDGQHPTGASLEVGMVRGRGATLRTVIEYQHLRIFLQQLMNLAVVVVNLLRLMLHTGDGEVDR